MKIGEMSRITKISEYTLRYYEKKGLIRINRDEFNRREYSEADIEWILFIKKIKDTGMILKDIKKYSDLRYEGDITITERLKMLIEHRNVILEERRKWDEYLANINNKISIYKNKLR